MNDFNLPKISEELDKEEFDYRNKYRNIYIRLIIRCQNMTEQELSGYNEKHHILPKCLGGGNEEENLVIMPVRYHMMAHMLLMTIYPDVRGLRYAIKAIINGSSDIVDRAALSQKYFSSRTLAYFREASRVKKKEDHPNYGKHLSEETKRKISQAHIGKKLSEETKRKMGDSRRGENNPNWGKGKILSEEKRKRLSDAHKGYHPSEETKRKLSIALSGEKNPMWKKVVSDETKRKLRENHADLSGANNPRAKKVIGPDGTVYSWTGEASEKSGIPKSTLQKWLRGERRSNNGWKYYTEDD